MKVILCLTIFFICGSCQNLLSAPNESTESKIERPCRVNNIGCIRRYFAENAKCKISHGPVPDPLYFEQTTAYLTAVNVTITLDDLHRSGLNGRIEEFYINEATDKLVLAVEFKNLRVNSNDTYYIYYRRGKEPIINKDYLRVFIDSVTITIIIPNIRDLQLRFGETYAYYNSPVGTFELGPNAFKGSDPGLKRAETEMYAKASIIFKEGMLADAAYNIISYIQHNICDFGL